MSTALRERKNAANRRYKARLRGEPVDYVSKPWTPNELHRLIEIYSGGPLNRDGQLKELAARLGRSFGAVATKAYEMGLTSPRDISRAQSDATCMAVSRQREAQTAANLPTGKTRGHGGRRDDIGGTYFRSTWEANYARFLTWSGVAWKYEPKTFRFDAIKRGTMSYTPDFYLPGDDEYHEVKGWMDPKSKTQLDRMSRYFPGVHIVVVDRAWFRDANRTGLASIVPGWERLSL